MNPLSSLGLPTILFLIFLILKLTHTITWSWWWVTAPLWLSALGAVALGVIGLIIWAVKVALSEPDRH